MNMQCTETFRNVEQSAKDKVKQQKTIYNMQYALRMRIL